MYHGFPTDMLSLLRCPVDAGALRVMEESAHQQYLLQAELACQDCQARYPVENGIVRLFDAATLDSTSQHEHPQRDHGAAKDNFKWESSAMSRMEIIPMLKSMTPLSGATVLELGCGKGRFTTLMAQNRATIIALDFSLAVLQRLATRIQPHWRIGLVQADCTKPVAAPRRFDRVLSTLVSNLPTAQHRRAMFQVVAQALKHDGKFIFGAHHHGLRERLRKVPQAGQYADSGIFRYLFRRREIVAECAPRFGRVRCRPIQVLLPMTNRLGIDSVTLSRLAERVPLVNQCGELLMDIAEKPRADV